MIWFYIFGAIVLLFGFVVAFGAPYVPSHRRDVRRVLAHLKIGAKDMVVDAGSGDGLVLREVAKRGASAVGYELNPALVLISRLYSLKYSKTRTLLANFWYVKFPADTTLVYIFSVGRDRKKLAVKIQAEANRLGRPLRLLSYGNSLQDRAADETFEAYSLYRFHPLQSEKAQV